MRHRRPKGSPNVPKLPAIDAHTASPQQLQQQRKAGGLAGLVAAKSRATSVAGGLKKGSSASPRTTSAHIHAAHGESLEQEATEESLWPGEEHDEEGSEDLEREHSGEVPETEHLGPVPLEDANYDPDLIPGIETGEDVIEFYGKNGQDSAVKFFYCNRAKESTRFRPYDLVVVPRQRVDSEYFTMSATGVMRIKRGVQAEFTTLAEWVREKTLFDLISTIGFFKNYLPERSFRRWHKGVRQKHFRNVRRKVEDNLFLVKPTFSSHLREIWASANDLRNVSFTSYNPSHLYTLQEWADLQTSTREQKARPMLESIVEKIQHVLEHVCRDVQKQAQLYQESVRDQAELDDTNGIELVQGRAAGRGRSMIAVKREKLERAQNFARVMKELTMLGRFIRLADYLFVEGMIECVTDSANQTLAMLVPHKGAGDKQSKGVFLTTISFAANGIQFTPDCESVLEELNVALEGIISVAQQAPRIVFMRAFAPYFDGKPSGLNPPSIIRATQMFQDVRSHVNTNITEAYKDAQEYVKIFEDYRKIYNFGRTWSFEEYTSKPKTLREIRRDMYKQREWRNELDRMKISHVVGCLFIDSKTLRNDLLPTTTNTLDMIKALLMDMSRDTCLEVLEDIQRRVSMLKQRPVVLDEFMAYQVMHQEQVDDKKKVLASASGVDDMYDMLAAYEHKVKAEESIKHDECRDAALNFVQELTNGKEFIADNKNSQMEALQSNIASITQELQEITSSLYQGDNVNPDADPEATAADLEQLLQHVRELRAACDTFRDYQRLFEMEEDSFEVAAQTEQETESRFQLWNSLNEFMEKSQEWTESPILDEDNNVELSIDQVRSEVEDYALRAYTMGKKNPDDPVVSRFKDCIDDFKQIMPMVEELANPALKKRHWDEIFRIIEADIPMNEANTGYSSFSVRMLLQYSVLDTFDQIQAISGMASKENSLEGILDKMAKDWEGVQFIVLEYKDTGTYIMAGSDEVQALLDDQIVKAQSMRASPFIKPLEERALKWEDLLVSLQDLLDNWLACQATWQYLEPIFSSPDILKQMPVEGEKFQIVDQAWRDLMEAVSANPAALAVGADKERLSSLQDCNQMLEEIQKGLSAYLELKRIAFPRFFFLSNDEMLEILSETKDPTRVQPHLKKCFEGIDKLHFDDNLEITGMISVESELVPMKRHIKPADAKGSVEKWLVQVEAGMVESVRDVCCHGVEAYARTPRPQWVLQWPGQVVLVVTAVYWTRGVEKALATQMKEAVKDEAQSSNAQLTDIINLVRGNLSKLNRATLAALVVMDVHARDVVQDLVDNEVSDPSSFAWLSQLRMYWEATHGDKDGKDGDKDFTVMVRMMSAQVEYGYEYLGNSMRLVVTPLTDRCYRTLMGAIHLNLGGAPEGPAGTGKTETTKDLAKALARQCVVFNCSDTLDYLTMAKFFKGLASSGSWACFDEFNRIDLEVLSVVAQQVHEIQTAMRSKQPRFFFEGSDLPIRHTCNVFITMNPGYAGRSELPDNLKALFRTVAMMVPDYALISEIMLYSNGYLKARECARKIVATYKLCSEQLSSQDHYDYGMRAVMAVLRAAGNLKRQYPQDDEFVLMLRSIVDVNLCKFLSHDVPLFEGIVSDLFPGIPLPNPNYEQLDAALRRQCAKRNLQPTVYFMKKTIQLYEMIIVRHGLMAVGQPFSGKSSSLAVLSSALSDLAENGIEGPLFTKVQTRILNPKAVTMGQLYGETDRATQEWKDGVVAVAFRGLAADPSSDLKWLILDGPVDAIWIENMNTVLDDNKKLCLPNSEIIQMSPTMSMIFEVGDLAVASPATVSRCGMVYLEPHQLGWRPLFTSWQNILPPALGMRTIKHIEVLFDWAMPACLRLVRKEIKEISPTEDSNIAQTTMRIIHSLLDNFKESPSNEDGLPPEGAALDEVSRAQMVEGIFLFALIWSAGCTGDGAGRARFNDFFRVLSTGDVPEGYDEYIPKRRPSLVVLPMPVEGTVYDYVFDKSSLGWKKWDETIPELQIPADARFSNIIVPTKDSARYTFLMDLALQHNQPLLMVGPTGTGKSVYITRHLTSGLPKDKWTPIFITFSARTSANMTQDQVDGRLEKRKKGLYAPPIGKRAVLFVDDLNMPAKEVYGAQPPIELLRQFMDYEGWYGRDNAFRAMTDVQTIMAMGPPGGGRTFVTNRFLRHFNTLALAQVSDDSLSYIFQAILDWHLDSKSYPRYIRKMSPQVIAATLQLYSRSTSTLLPTPTKSHYVFNLRDFARVVQGVMMLPKAALPGSEPDACALYKRLWIHEALRVFYDRLVDEADREWLLDQLKDITESTLEVESLVGLMAHILPKNKAGAQRLVTDDLRRCFFGNFANPKLDVDERIYTEIADVQHLIGVVEDYLKDYNSISKRPMNLAMFLFAVEHISRICRLLSQPGGHMLLVGVGGSGRQSLTRLASHICGMQVFQVEISKSYGRAEWREDLKKVLQRAGAETKPTVFLFSDAQIKEESFVEDINNLLNAGEVPNMFPSDERMAILEAVRPEASKQGLETPVELWGFFVQQCRTYLHVVWCSSPIGSAFRERLRQNPSIVNCCTIDWFQKWPEDALEAVAYKFLKEMGNNLEDATRIKLVTLCQEMHRFIVKVSQDFLQDQGRYNYVTPTSYLELITCFKSLLEAKRTQITKLRKRYMVGLEKLRSSGEQVAGMQAELQALQPQLVRTVAEVEQLMGNIAREKKEVVEPKAAIVKEEEGRAKGKADAAKAIKDECEADLEEAIPILNDALAALDTIKEADINYIKKLGNPPGAIKLVLEAVCVILDVKPAKIKDDSGKMVADYWKPSVGLLNEKDFLQRLKTYDKDNIPPRIIAEIRSKYLTNETFTPETAKKASPAAEGMCKWVHAMSSYDKVAKVVAPKKAKLAEAEGSYQEVMVGLRQKQDELQQIMDKLGGMEKSLQKNTHKKERLEVEVEQCSLKLGRAEQLIGGLGGEKARWTETAENLAQEFTNLTGDMLISAGVVAYAGAFTPTYRNSIVRAFLEMCKVARIPHNPKFSLAAVLGEPVKVREWLIASLPNDTFSIENAIIVAKARRWPLCVDPQGQANKWIKNLERPHKLNVIKLSEGGEYMRTLENAIQFGLPVLLENVGEELDPSLEPLLLKQTFKQGGNTCIRLGDATVEYSSDFRFYITTKLRNPHYLPEVSVKVTLLNFMITPAGLSDQMLGVAVATERPDLEEQKASLVVMGAENNRKLKEIEDKILEVLSNSQGNILEDETAIHIITDAKVLGNEIAEKQKAAEATEREIDTTRAGYKPCGDYTSILFFCISDLANIDPMYQYSLLWFVNLFVASVNAAAKDPELPQRLANIYDHFTYSLYCNVCRSLFEKDKLLFAFLLCVRIMEFKGSIDSEEWMFLLTGGLGVVQPRPNPTTWLVDKGWREVLQLNQLPTFMGIADSVEQSPEGWKKLYDAPDPHKVTLPGLYNSLDSFRKLLILRCFRPDKVLPAIQEFVQVNLGKKYVDSPPFDLQACYNDSSPTTPLIFVLSPGSDPTAALSQFAASVGMGSRISAVSLGQGQGAKAAALVTEGANIGNWVILQNCHLAPSWMPALDKICEELNPETINPEFRLWMTSYPSPRFPVNILQNGVKMTNEPPKGLRANVRRSYCMEPFANEAEFFETCNKPQAFKKLLFGLAFFHALVQERRRFGPLGWNIAYGFDDGDLRISARQLHMMLQENQQVPYQALRYVTGECNYGGRVTDDKDRLLLNTLLERCYCPQVVDDPNYKFSLSGLYFPPEEGSRASHLEYIDSLPATSHPEAFGLHANADIAKDQTDTYAMFSSLLTSASGGGGGKGGDAGGGQETDRVALVISQCLQVLPPNFNIEAVQHKYPVLYEESLNTVLVQEMSRFNRLLEVIRSSLKSMDLALKGLQVMSSDLEHAHRSISLNQVPDMWRRVSYPSLKPLGSYLEDLYRRLHMLSSWHEKGPPPVFWLSGFFFVQSFLTAGLQNYVRRHKIPIDMVCYDFEMCAVDVKEASTTALCSPDEGGLVVHGLFLEGCGWDAQAGMLCESAPKVLFVPAPCIRLKPKMADQLSTTNHYNCPLYRTAERRGTLATTGHSTNFVMFVKMPTDQAASHWIMRGVALLSALSD